MKLLLLAYCNLLFTWGWFCYLVTLFIKILGVTFQPLWKQALVKSLFLFLFSCLSIDLAVWLHYSGRLDWISTGFGQQKKKKKSFKVPSFSAWLKRRRLKTGRAWVNTRPWLSAINELPTHLSKTQDSGFSFILMPLGKDLTVHVFLLFPRHCHVQSIWNARKQELLSNCVFCIAS